jgi:hypothetical protein
MVPALDWLENYGPAALAVWHGLSPFSVPVFFAAPWAVFLLIPFALLPHNLGRWCLLVLAICAYALLAYRLGAKPMTMALLLLSYPVLADITNGNIEWLAMLGFILPAQIGLIFVLIKPQVGIGVALYWLMEAWHTGGIRQVIKTFAPVTILFLLSFALYGFWPLYFLNTLQMAREIRSAQAIDYNFSLWPWGLLIGLPLLVQSIRRREKRLSMMSSPFLAPYALIATYGTCLLAWIDQPVLFFIAWLLTWLPMLWKLLAR